MMIVWLVNSMLLSFHTVMRVLIVFMIALVVSACAGQSAPDTASAPAVAAAPAVATTSDVQPAAPTGEGPAEVETVEANELVANEQFCTMRAVTGSIRKQRVCRGRNTGPEEVVDEAQIREVLRDMEHNHATGTLMNR
jgi:hypothetical protein